MKRNMKRIMRGAMRTFALSMALCLFSAFAFAEDLTNRPLADGVVTAPHYVDLTAPMSGTLSAFDLEAGDEVAAGQTLMGFVTTGIYASEEAEVKTVFAQVGDSTADVITRYGTLLGLEPAASQLIQATTAGAYNDKENKLLHLGETLYFKSAKADRTKGFGQVIAVSGDSYVVEIQEGDFELKESLTLYREDDYENSSCVGKGTVSRRDDLTVQGSGRVSAVYVQAGETVTKGQLLLELVSADAEPDAVSSTIVSVVEGVVGSVSVSPGQQVWKGQHLCRIYLTDALEVTAEVDEMDLGDLRVGDTVPVTLDVAKDRVLDGVVTEISALGVTQQNAAYFTVRVSIPDSSAMLGASASIYLPAE